MKKRKEALAGPYRHLEGLPRLLLLLLVFSLLLPLSARASTVQDMIDQAREEQEETQEELGEVREDQAGLEEGQEEVQVQMDATGERIAMTMASIALSEKEIEDLEMQIEKAQAAVDTAQTNEALLYGRIKRRIQSIYETGDTTYLDVLFHAADMSELQSRAEYIEALYAYDRRMLQGYRDSRERRQEAQKVLEERRQAEEEAREELEESRKRLEEDLKDQKTRYIDYQVRIETLEARAQDLQDQLWEEGQSIQALEAERIRQEEEARAAAAAAEAEGDPENNPEEAREEIPAVPSGGAGAELAAYACQFVGNPYLWGGTSLTRGCDCSGFTMAVYAHFGVTLPRLAEEQVYSGTSVPSLAQARPGDLICYPGHVSIYVGDGVIVHAANQAAGICYGNASYRSILSIRRILGN